MDLFHFLYSYIFLTKHNPCLFFLAYLQGWYATLLIHYSSLFCLFLHFLSFLWLSLISCSDPPSVHSRSITCPTPCLFCIILFLHFPGIDLHVHYPICVPVCPSLPAHTQTHTHTAPACLGIQSFLLLLKVSNLHLPVGPHPYLMKESSELHSS